VIVVDALRFRKRLENDGEIVLTGLPGKKGEEAEVIVLFERNPREGGMTLGELARSDIVGMWKDRTDIGDSGEYARKLRKAIQRRRR
jgi:hypothetical protein